MEFMVENALNAADSTKTNHLLTQKSLQITSYLTNFQCGTPTSGLGQFWSFIVSPGKGILEKHSTKSKEKRRLHLQNIMDFT